MAGGAVMLVAAAIAFDALTLLGNAQASISLNGQSAGETASASIGIGLIVTIIGVVVGALGGAIATRKQRL